MLNAYFFLMAALKHFRVLVVDDDIDILDLLEYNFRKAGFRVKILNDSRYAVQEAKRFDPHLIILDIMMPYFSGFEICRDLRAIHSFKEVYIFLLTALSDHHYQQQAYCTGADDYIEKIIGLRALTHKVNTVLRNNYVIRKRILHLTAGALQLNRETNMAVIHGKEIMLSAPEFELLFFLAQNAGKTITQENLIHNIWGSEIYLFDSPIDNYMHSLRKKLGIPLIQQKDNRYKLIL